MKKLVIKCVIMILMFIGASQFFVYIMTGKSPLDGWEMPNISLNPSDIKNITSGGKQTVYKWIDENGLTQYSAEPPPDQLQSKTLTLDPNTNIVQAIKMPNEEKEEESKPAQVALPQGPIYSPESIKKLIDDAQGIETLLQDRFDKQNDMLNEI